MSHGANETSATDPCADIGPEQRKAFIWFVAVIIIGVALSFQLASIDRWMYDNNGELFDLAKIRENRRAGTSLPSERLDERLNGNYSEAVTKLTKGTR